MYSSVEIRSLIWAATVMGVCALAVWRGGALERLAAGAMLAGWALTMLVYRAGFEQTEWGILVVDFTALGVFVWIALRSDRFWPLFAAGFHLLAIVTHFANAVDAKVGAWAYITAEIMWGYLLAFAIAFGAWRHRPDQLAIDAEEDDTPGDIRR